MKAKDLEYAKHYLDEVLGLRVSFAPFSEVATLPYALQESYAFYEATIEGRRFLAILPRGDDASPASLEKQTAWLEERSGIRCIVVLPTLDSHNRRRLIQRRIPFIIPGAQLYLPDLGMLFREQSQRAAKKTKPITPAAQALVIAACLGRVPTHNSFSATALASRLGYTKMTLSRSLEELRQLELVHDEGNPRDGNTRFRFFGRELWEKARPTLRSPVKRRVYLEEWQGGPALLAGESALAEQTNLVAPPRKTWALGPADWKDMQVHLRFRMLSEAAKESARHEIEVWSYAPSRLTEGPYADPFSIALSLAEQTDDRVQIAVDELLKRLW